MRTTKFLCRTLLPLAFALAVTLTGCGKKEAEDTGNQRSIDIGYADSAIVLEDNDALQKAYDEAVKNEREGRIALHYYAEARSTDGIHFIGQWGNSSGNVRDMFFALYADPEFTDELYVSQLLKPGTALEEIDLNHALDPGVNTVYAAFTTVVQEDGETKISGQALVTIDFIVAE